MEKKIPRDDGGEAADLGLGEGLKPGSVWTDELKNTLRYSALARDKREDSLSDSETVSLDNCKQKNSLLRRLRRRQKGHILPGPKTFQTAVTHVDREKYEKPVSFMNTSTTNSSEKLANDSESKESIPIMMVRDSGKGYMELDRQAVMDKLINTQQEVEELKQELEQCEKQLCAKYKAVQILYAQISMESSSEIDQTSAVNSLETTKSLEIQEQNRQLQKQLNTLQFEMDYRQSCFLTSQDLWTTRFEGASSENTQLTEALEKKGNQMKKLHAENLSLKRERDELLAFVDVQERSRFASTKSSQSEDESHVYNNFGTMELAVLGACQCRVRDPDPCACAHAAANRAREITALKQQVHEKEKSLEETGLLADAYRRAFEEQLTRNRDLIGRLGQLTISSPSTAEKAKNAVKWLIKQLNEDESILPRRMRGLAKEMSPDNEEAPFDTDIEQLFAEVHETPQSVGLEGGNIPALDGSDLVSGVELDTQNEQQLLQLLIELVSDKTEALIHSRLAARVLAKRNKELQIKLNAFTEGPNEVLNKR